MGQGDPGKAQHQGESRMNSPVNGPFFVLPFRHERPCPRSQINERSLYVHARQSCSFCVFREPASLDLPWPPRQLRAALMPSPAPGNSENKSDLNAAGIRITSNSYQRTARKFPLGVRFSASCKRGGCRRLPSASAIAKKRRPIRPPGPLRL